MTEADIVRMLKKFATISDARNVPRVSAIMTAAADAIEQLQARLAEASKPLYTVTAGNQYEGDTYIGSYATLAEAREVKEKHAHWDWCNIDCVQCGKYVPVPEEA